MMMVAPEILPPDWWQVYGPFKPGVGNFPHIGHVIRWYRETQGLEIEDLARELHLSVRRTYELEETAAMPKSIPRREALAQILGIPLVLLNLPHSPRAVGTINVIPSHTMQAYEDVLTLAWGSYYTSSTQRAASTAGHWLQLLRREIESVRSVAQDQLTALLCRFLQLAGVIARDGLDFRQARLYCDEAIQLAFQIGNAELIASSLYRRAKIYVEQQQYPLAIQDLEAALPYANQSRDPLRCYVSIFLAEVSSLLAPKDLQIQGKSLTLLDHVGRTVRKSKVLEDDGSFAKVDIPGLYMIRGDVLRRFGNIKEAENALLIVRDNLPPEFTRWQSNLLISEAMLCHANGDLEGACQIALDALPVVRATHSRSNEAKIEQLYWNFYKAQPLRPDVRELGRQLSLR
jgi:tetratricopeptide (TPR) repeat protein